MRRQKYLIPILALGTMSILVLAMIFPSTAINTEAAELARTTDATPLTLAVALPPAIDLEIEPSPAGTFAQSSTNLIIATDAIDGYKIYLSANDNKLASSDASVAATIDSISNDATESNFPVNSWGYSLSLGETEASSLYSPIPALSDNPVIEIAKTASSHDIYELTLAAKVDTALPAGAYTGNILISVVATPQIMRGINDITYMQEMTADVCANSVLHETKQLIDKRDNTSYWVAKLADGNCWMTQNLALNLTAGDILTSELSDVANSWTVTKSTETEVPTKNEDIDDTRSWSFGQLVIVNPTSTAGCSEVYGNKKISDCQYVQDVTGWQATYKATPSSSIDASAKTYDAHYLIGNYYQYGTATAETSNYSICPKGWRLPSSGRNTSTGAPTDRKFSFYNLFYAYGYPKNDKITNDTSLRDTYWVTATDIASTLRSKTNVTGPDKTRLDYEPTYFIHGGNVGSNRLYSVGHTGFYRSNFAFPKFDSYTQRYYILSISGDVDVASESMRSNGFSVRCVAR